METKLWKCCFPHRLNQKKEIDRKTDQHVVVEELLDAVGLAAAVEEPGDDHGQLKVVQLVDANLAKDRS